MGTHVISLSLSLLKWKEVGGEWGERTEEMKEEPQLPQLKVTTTPWGLTDDIVTLPNQKMYFFFRLPHKVNREHKIVSFFIGVVIFMYSSVSH